MPEKPERSFVEDANPLEPRQISQLPKDAGVVEVKFFQVQVAEDLLELTFLDDMMTVALLVVIELFQPQVLEREV